MRQTQNTKKDNRKSIFVIALLLLLVAVIGFGGYTMSKYISSKTEKGSASVAKWGFTVTANSDELFGQNYKFVENVSKVTKDTGSLTVKADTKNDTEEQKRMVVAPGTTGKITFDIKGKAEVLAAVKIDFDYTHDVALKYTNNGADVATPYTPVVWTLKKGTKTLATGTLAAIKTELLKVAETKIEAGTEVNDSYELSWAWAFEGGHDELDTLLGMYSNDTASTTNGLYAVVADGTDTQIEFTLNLSVVQLQENKAA